MNWPLKPRAKDINWGKKQASQKTCEKKLPSEMLCRIKALQCFCMLLGNKKAKFKKEAFSEEISEEPKRSPVIESQSLHKEMQSCKVAEC